MRPSLFSPSLVPLLSFLSFLTLPAPLAADLEDTLNARYRGAWVVVEVNLSSDCNGFFTDNEVVGQRTSGKGSEAFSAGELARVERVDVKRSRVDVFLELAEAVLTPRREGPFTLYDERTCKMQLQVPNDRGADPTPALAALVVVHPDRRAAERDEGWNGRRRAAYPANYEETLAAYEVWKAEQLNLAVGERLDRALDEAARFRDQLRDHPEYLAGFAAGFASMRSHYYGDCASLVNASFYPNSPSGSADYRKGHQDGQALAFHLELARRLRGCFVPVARP